MFALFVLYRRVPPNFGVKRQSCIFDCSAFAQVVVEYPILRSMLVGGKILCLVEPVCAESTRLPRWGLSILELNHLVIVAVSIRTSSPSDSWP